MTAEPAKVAKVHRRYQGPEPLCKGCWRELLKPIAVFVLVLIAVIGFFVATLYGAGLLK